MDQTTQQLLLLGVRTRKAELQAQLEELNQKEAKLLGQQPAPINNHGKRELSPETRQKMADAARRRWAAKKR